MTFEQLIADSMKNGRKTKEQIAKEFTDALNSIDSKSKEKEKRKAKLAMFRDIASNELKNTIRNPVPMDVGRLAALVYADKHLEWTAEDLDKFAEMVTKSAEMAEKTYGKNSIEQMSILGRELNDALNKGLEDFGIEFRIEGPSERSRDEEAIHRFLRDLFD